MITILMMSGKIAFSNKGIITLVLYGFDQKKQFFEGLVQDQ